MVKVFSTKLTPLELSEGDRFSTPTVAASQGLGIPAGESRVHLILALDNGKVLWLPLQDRHVGRKIATDLDPLFADESQEP